MTNITFLNIHFLWAIFAIPIMIALHFVLMKYTRRRAVLFANFEALKRVTGAVVLSKNITILIVRLFIILFLTLSAAGMIFWAKGPSSEFNYVVAIDASSSMLADDFDPNRLAVAKETAIDFVDLLNAKVSLGVVSFSGISKINHRLTDNKADTIESIENIKISRAGGTDISGAITTSVNVLEIDEKKGRSIILMTDGQHTAGGPLDEGINYAIEKNVIVHTIGLATDKGGSFELTKLLSTVDEVSLTRIADNTGGKFFIAGDKAQMTAAFNQIITLSEQNVPYQLRLPFLLISILLLFIEWILLNTRFKALP